MTQYLKPLGQSYQSFSHIAGDVIDTTPVNTAAPIHHDLPEKYFLLQTADIYIVLLIIGVPQCPD